MIDQYKNNINICEINHKTQTFIAAFNKYVLG